MKELNNVDILFLKSVTESVPEGAEHKFSFRYKLRRKQIINNWAKEQNTSVYRRPAVKLKYILIVILIACIAALAGFGIFDLFEGFRVTDYDIYSILYIVDDVSTYPDSIKKKAYIDMDMSDYTKEITSDIKYQYFIKYRSSDISITVNQMTKKAFKSVRINTEDVLQKPTQIVLNEHNGIYYQTKNGVNCIIVNFDEYIIMYTSNMNKNELENIVKMTKFTNL